MDLSPANQKKLLEAIASTMIAHADELTDLDQAIGDGDHGINMRRGFEAVLTDLSAVAEKEPGDAFKSVAMTLLKTIGGASGPLYSTIFLALSKELKQDMSFSDWGPAWTTATEAVKKRGKSDVGAKTMLDVLAPVAARISSGATPSEVKVAASDAADATIDMLATRGRASFLKERSIGHMDPGARSSQLLIDCICDHYGG